MESNENKKLVLTSLEEIQRHVRLHMNFRDPFIVGPWTKGCLSFGPGDPKAYDKVYDIDIGSFHICTCHDLAAISFFRYIPGKGYRPTKVTFHSGERKKEFKYVLLGQVTERIYEPE